MKHDAPNVLLDVKSIDGAKLGSVEAGDGWDKMCSWDSSGHQNLFDSSCRSRGEVISCKLSQVHQAQLTVSLTCGHVGRKRTPDLQIVFL